MEAPPDAAQARLLALARAGDAQAFGQLVAAHQSRVRQQLRRLCHGDAARADDLAQDCFLQAWRALPGFRGDARLATWLHRIAYRCFLMQQRAAGPVAVSIDTDVSADVAAAWVDPRPSPALGIDLERALAALPDAQRWALICPKCKYGDNRDEPSGSPGSPRRSAYPSSVLLTNQSSRARAAV
jgi:RNA polymerase sigma-70 factor (ECF subfamily)